MRTSLLAMIGGLGVALLFGIGCAGGSSGAGANGGTNGAGGSSGSGGTTGVAGQSGSGGANAGMAGTAGGQGGVSGGGAAGAGTAGNTDGGSAGRDGATGDVPDAAPTVPELVTSGPNAYWIAGTPTKVTSGTAGLIVDATTKYQRFDGFGGCFNEMGWDAMSVLSPADATNALRLLFDARDGANFIYGRLPVGASDYSMSTYTLDDTAGDFAMANFSIDRDRQKLIPYIKAAMQIRPDLHLWASPWIPPDWMKDSAGNMKGDAQTQGAYALYLARFVEEYGKEGLKIEAIHPQNEPGYASVKWTQALFINFFKTYLGPTFAQRSVPAEIWCGTMSAPADGTWATALASDPAALQYVKGFGLQWNLQTTVAALAPKGPVWQTEHKCGNYNFATPYWDQSRYDPNKPQNDHAYGEESWQLIRDWIVAGVNAYSAWNMVLDTIGKSLTGWPQNALLVVDRAAKKLIVTPAYYTFRHFSQYVAPGATRIKITGSTDALAFQNVDGSIITEVYNKGTSALTTTVAVSGALYRFDVPAHGWATLRTTP